MWKSRRPHTMHPRLRPPLILSMRRFSLATVNRARSSTKRKIPIAEAKIRVLDAIREGLSVADAMLLVERTVHTYRDWRDADPEFAASVDQYREVAKAARDRGANGKVEVPDFP